MRAGVNLVDTSANYGDGGSEILIGQVLARAVRGSVAGREDPVVVVTKAGYLQGTALELAHERQPPYPDLVRYQDNCWHCLHPEFLADQLALSRQRLGLQTIDVFLLHNPEYFFIDRENRAGEVTAEDREGVDRRLREAFGSSSRPCCAARSHGTGVVELLRRPAGQRPVRLARPRAGARARGGGALCTTSRSPSCRSTSTSSAG